MALEYKDAGTVGSKRGAKDGAQHKKVDLRDLHIRNAGGQSTVQKTSEFKRRSPNSYLKGEAANNLARRVFKEHRAGKSVREIAGCFELSQTKIRVLVNRGLDAEFRDVTAPRMIQQYCDEGRQLDIPLNVLLGKRTGVHCWTSKMLNEGALLREVKALYEDFTLEHLQHCIYNCDAHLAKIEALIGPLQLMSVEAFHHRARQRVAAYRSQNRFHKIRYIDWDTRPNSYFACTNRYEQWHDWVLHPRVNECFNPNQTLHDIIARMESVFSAAIYYRNQEAAEAEYRHLERLIAENNGPREFTQFVAQGRAIWRKRKADRAEAAYNSTPDPIVEARQRESIARSRLITHAGTIAIRMALMFGSIILLAHEMSVINDPQYLARMNVPAMSFYITAFIAGAAAVALALFTFQSARGFSQQIKEHRSAKASLDHQMDRGSALT
ncbi:MULTISPECIES: hypothetical protein [Pseudomonadota]|jgi:hypothetical protein|uniref:hypothetical protein n=3 Tax=Pseudomonadota TaxID=1224 RepID=UPI0007372E38|nr:MULTISPECIES: hypothetical protein [Pseudomonadota]MBA4174525.1 hypothetical protein [Hyphomicrobium sp.]KTE12048.1 hypothetical protein ATE71_10745 [Sphingopyxis sp. H115]KTE18000.1 hypothetical protein ATE67_20215 [Sphingopyxis sp. H050]MBA4234057.1 hypothetical protein [Ralstonia sp.]MDT7531848.1 hypothetical protein [Sphingopyxis sp. SE2]|tara:strand:+ start:80009 stop:81325 length:1317 start_codon:yes stop_codon:yes gene_type:complete